MYLVFTCMPGDSYRRWLRSLLCLCCIFRALITTPLFVDSTCMGLILFQIYTIWFICHRSHVCSVIHNYFTKLVLAMVSCEENHHTYKYLRLCERRKAAAATEPSPHWVSLPSVQTEAGNPNLGSLSWATRGYTTDENTYALLWILSSNSCNCSILDFSVCCY